jgi:hypothetical protein
MWNCKVLMRYSGNTLVEISIVFRPQFFYHDTNKNTAFRRNYHGRETGSNPETYRVAGQN